MDTKAFGERVLRARLEYGARLNPPRSVSQVDLGEMIGLSGQAVGTWEAGKKEPDLDTIARLARVLGVRAAWLAFNDGPMRADEGGQGARTNGSPAPTPDTIVQRGREGVPTAQQPQIRKKKGPSKRRPGDKTAAA